MSTCIVCGSFENLNTTLNITLDGGNKVNVFVCDVHAEDITVKIAKAKYLARQAEIEEVLAKAKSLGIDLSQTTTQNKLVLPTTVPVQQLPQIPVQNNIMDDMVGDDVISTDRLNKKIITQGGNIDGYSVEANQSLDDSIITQKLDSAVFNGVAKMMNVETPSGPVSIPRKRVDGTGVTTISINKSNDAQLQRHFKSIADQGSFKGGYNEKQVKCSLCNGSQMYRGKTCVKCNGSGFIISNG